ncbi:MAG: DUF1289 domain-containing protein [Polymorphobacter sp.]|uniref:DUF1289 domain-containing protein n=1 Tax=Polymorphobacter sp. TaxID=1909290 RepID=UPI003A8B9C92
MSVPSPCINVCRIDRKSGYCEGCRRTVDEIMAWPTATDEAKRAVLAALPARKVRRSILPW